MTERTVQKITKVIRGTSRSESRSKKTRESSLSPKGAKADHEKSGTKKNDGGKTDCKKTTEKDKKTALAQAQRLSPIDAPIAQFLPNATVHWSPV